MLELHTLWFEFIAPWWHSSKTNGWDNFPFTFKAIDELEEESLKTKKTEQVTAGINAGFIEIVKLSNYLLSAPLLFAVFTDPKRGPSVARAFMKIMKDCNNSSQ